MSSLRPFVPGLWRQLPDTDKRTFLLHLARYWEVHRHLLPPPTARRLTALRVAGRLVIQHGRIQTVSPDAGRLRLRLAAGRDEVELNADWLVNATGMAADISASESPLLQDLFETGLARPDPLRLGVDATAEGALVSAAGTPSEVVYALGPPLRGVWYETTAIPEIRQQAADLAELITGDGRLARRVPHSAA
jgi:uncharacterized NAD(P)/FAD-binding protein YdhS